MKPETKLFMQKSYELLRKAEELLNRNRWPEEAGRAAYLAGFHAAQALLFEERDKIFKTHKGVHGEFGRLLKDEPRFDLELRAFLSRTYNLKVIADYEVDGGAKVTEEEASEVIRVARHLVEQVDQRIASAGT
jgi:uncharacterized protein (UPF0332 family)